MLKKILAAATTLLLAVGIIATTALPASADPVYTVDANGITLPAGSTFHDGQEINLTSTPQGTTIHFESKCITLTGSNPECAGFPNQVAQYIGQSAIPWSAFGLTGSFCVSWVQVGGFNYHFGTGGNGEPQYCSTPVTIPSDATASVTVHDATCALPQTVTLDTAVNASWGSIVYSGPANLHYAVTATADSGHTFAGGAATKDFSGDLSPKLSSENPACAPPKVCVPTSSVSYTYDPASNSGVITVNDIPNSTGQLCDGFWVTATSWKYTGSGVWPQIRDVVQKLPKITTVGSYPYVAQVTCGQGDIYASFSAQPDPTENLYGPGNPFAEHFLHDMGFSGPNPTYVQQTPGCTTVTPLIPTATPATACGTTGSISVPADTAQLTYTVTGTGNQGAYTVVATTISPAHFADNTTSKEWDFNLGYPVDCNQQVCDTITNAPVSTNLDPAGWSFAESRSGGHHTYVSGGLQISTDAADYNGKSAGYVAADFPLGQTGTPSLTYDNTSGGAEPGIQLSVFVNGAFFGNLVHEPLFAQWWSSHAVAGMPAGPNPSYQLSYGSIDDYLFAWAQLGITDVKVKAVGFSLGSGALGSGTISQITAGCEKYTFDTASYQPSVTFHVGECYPNGDFSSKNVYLVFDNTQSTVPVTFTVPNALDVQSPISPTPSITVTVPGGQTATVETTPIWQYGGAYDVYADGNLLSTVTLPSFEGCQDGGQPGDPQASDAVCTNGVQGDGSIWVDLQPGLKYTITDANDVVIVADVQTAFTSVPAGDYIVKVEARPGYTLVGPVGWPFPITVADAVDCQQFPTPPVTFVATACGADGTYTLPEETGVKYLVNGSPTPFGTYSVPTTTSAAVHIEALPVDAQNGFLPGQTVWDYTFVAPLDCQLPDHPIVAPAVVFVQSGCDAAGTFTLSNDLGISDAIIWTVDAGTGVSFASATVTPEGTHQITGRGVVTIHAAPNEPDFGFAEGTTQDWSFDFEPPVNCVTDLKTLALTGGNATGWLSLSGLLLLLGAGFVTYSVLRKRLQETPEN